MSTSKSLAKAAIGAGVKVTPLASQGDWLGRLGIHARAKALIAANPGKSTEVHAALERLTAPDQMGELFKVIAIHSPDWPAPAGLA